MRDNTWLENTMYELWENHFVDIPRKNSVLIKFGKRSKRQLGCINWARMTSKGLKKILPRKNSEDDKRISLITITKYFQDPGIPEPIVVATIAHEMCHYAHGFNSPLQQLYNHPHKGGVIYKEMHTRGLGQLYKEARKWLRTNWREYLQTHR